MRVSQRGTAPLALYIREAAEQVGVGVLELHRVRGRNAWRFRLVPGTTRQWQRYSASWVRTRANKRRRVHGVCWHGHRAFMRALFALAPNACVSTAHASYRGAQHFEATHSETGERNVGAPIAPIAFVLLCDCPETAARRVAHGLASAT